MYIDQNVAAYVQQDEVEDYYKHNDVCQQQRLFNIHKVKTHLPNLPPRIPRKKRNDESMQKVRFEQTPDFSIPNFDHKDKVTSWRSLRMRKEHSLEGIFTGGLPCTSWRSLRMRREHALEGMLADLPCVAFRTNKSNKKRRRLSLPIANSNERKMISKMILKRRNSDCTAFAA